MTVQYDLYLVNLAFLSLHDVSPTFAADELQRDKRSLRQGQVKMIGQYVLHRAFKSAAE